MNLKSDDDLRKKKTLLRCESENEQAVSESSEDVHDRICQLNCVSSFTAVSLLDQFTA